MAVQSYGQGFCRAETLSYLIAFLKKSAEEKEKKQNTSKSKEVPAVPSNERKSCKKTG